MPGVLVAGPPDIGYVNLLSLNPNVPDMDAYNTEESVTLAAMGPAGLNVLPQSIDPSGLLNNSLAPAFQNGPNVPPGPDQGFRFTYDGGLRGAMAWQDIISKYYKRRYWVMVYWVVSVSVSEQSTSSSGSGSGSDSGSGSGSESSSGAVQPNAVNGFTYLSWQVDGMCSAVPGQQYTAVSNFINSLPTVDPVYAALSDGVSKDDIIAWAGDSTEPHHFDIGTTYRNLFPGTSLDVLAAFSSRLCPNDQTQMDWELLMIQQPKQPPPTAQLTQ